MSASWDQNYHSRKPPKASPRSKVDDMGGGGVSVVSLLYLAFQAKCFVFLANLELFYLNSFS